MLRPSLFVLSVAASAPASASDFVVPPGFAFAGVAQSGWTGFYGGLQTETLGGASGPDEVNGRLSGAFAGYRHDHEGVTIGVEVDYLQGTMDFSANPVGFIPISLEYDTVFWRLGGEVGLNLGRTLPYLTAGYAQMQLDFDTLGLAEPDHGVFVGIGLDYRTSDRMTVGIEALYHELRNSEGGADTNFTSLGVTVAFSF